MSRDAHDLWHDAAASYGVSVTAILEVLARRLPTADEADEVHLGIDEQLVRQARQIDATRRSRRPGVEPSTAT